jgi:ribosomal protein S27E
MAVACVEPLPLYRPRDPQASDLWRLLDQHFETFQRVYDERFAAKYGFWRPIVERSVTAFLKCGDLQEGFARVRCPDCHHEMFVAFSCKQRCTCPSCHQKRALLTAIHVAEDVCAPVAHRQVVLTIPKRLRLHTRFDRKLLGKLCACAWTDPAYRVPPRPKFAACSAGMTSCLAWWPRFSRSANSSTGTRTSTCY